MEDLKIITYQGHDLDQSEKARETFSTIGFQQRNKLTNQRAPNETNGPAITKKQQKRKHTPPNLHTKTRDASRNGS